MFLIPQITPWGYRCITGKDYIPSLGVYLYPAHCRFRVEKVHRGATTPIYRAAAKNPQTSPGGIRVPQGAFTEIPQTFPGGTWGTWDPFFPGGTGVEFF